MKNKNWGGKRKGSGRKKIETTEKKNGITFYLTDNDIEFIESFTGENRSECLRNLLNILKNKLEK